MGITRNQLFHHTLKTPGKNFYCLFFIRTVPRDARETVPRNTQEKCFRTLAILLHNHTDVLRWNRCLWYSPRAPSVSLCLFGVNEYYPAGCKRRISAQWSKNMRSPFKKIEWYRDSMSLWPAPENEIHHNRVLQAPLSQSYEHYNVYIHKLNMQIDSNTYVYISVYICVYVCMYVWYSCVYTYTCMYILVHRCK